MSRITKEINTVTGTIINVAGKLIIYVLVFLLLYEGVTAGYKFGHDIFYSEAMEEEPGTDQIFNVALGQSKLEIAEHMQKAGLIKNAYATMIQMYFYNYQMVPGSYTLNTSMTSKELLGEMDDAAAQAKEKVKEAAREESQAQMVSETVEETVQETMEETAQETVEETAPEISAEPEIVIEPEVVIQ